MAAWECMAARPCSRPAVLRLRVRPLSIVLGLAAWHHHQIGQIGWPAAARGRERRKIRAVLALWTVATSNTLGIARKDRSARDAAPIAIRMQLFSLAAPGHRSSLIRLCPGVLAVLHWSSAFLTPNEV
jgi:hypothetical protein